MAKKRHGRQFQKAKPKRIGIVAYAKKLKNRLTPAEVHLWYHLQKAMLKWGVEFESQAIVGARFIGDFVCYKSQLIVEVDGSIHKLRRVRAKDRYRTVTLEALGYTIIRFENQQVFRDVAKVLAEIERYL